MSVVFDHREAGTPEAEWLRVAPWRDRPPVHLDIDRLVVLAAHPDDETLGAGGLLARAAELGIATTVVVVTDGDPAGTDPGERSTRRRRESVAALGELAPRAALVFLGFTDGGVREERERIAAAVANAIGTTAAERTLLVAPWWGDGHRDHRVLGEIALSLAGPGLRIVGYPIWLWHWADPHRVDTTAWRTLKLDERMRDAKQRAVAAHRSQLSPADADEAPMLHENTVAHFMRDTEVFVTADAPAPHPPSAAEFEAFHRRHEDPWGLESRWYEQRKRALLLAALPRPRFRRALELGCAAGATTRRLAARADAVTAVDSSATALARARDRGVPEGVVYAQHDLPDSWPDGDADLVVLSELGYYWSVDQLTRALDRVDATASADAVFVLCHWRHPIADAPSSGDDVHRAVARDGRWRRLSRHIEEDFLLDVLVRPGQPSIATAEGLR